MESIKTRKKGLTSLVLLLVSVAMLATSTFAYFTDTATVKGSEINAGNLSVEVVMTGEEIGKALFGSDYGSTVEFSHIEGTYLDRPLVSTATAENDKFIVTDKKVSVIKLEDVEPGYSKLVSITAANTGNLALSLSAGFTIDPNMSLTGLQNLCNGAAEGAEPDYTKAGTLTGDNKNKLVKLKAMQLAIDPTTKTQLPLSKANDLGGHLEDVIEVYAATSSYAGDNKGEQIFNDIITVNEKYKDAAAKEAEDNTQLNPKYIGTITQVMHANVAYISSLDATDDAEEIAELTAVMERLQKAASGVAVPKDKAGIEITMEYPAVGTLPAASGKFTGSQTSTAYFVLHMPTNVDNLYQNAKLTLNIGVTATQIESDEDGTGYKLYDWNRTTQIPLS